MTLDFKKTIKNLFFGGNIKIKSSVMIGIFTKKYSTLDFFPPNFSPQINIPIFV